MQLFHHPDAADLAALWGHQFQLIERISPPADQLEPFLWAVDDHLELHSGIAAGWVGGIWIGGDEVQRRASQGGELARACGVSRDAPPTVLDAMAGWGIDGLVLACRGCRVTSIEFHPLVSALAQDLIRRVGLTQVTCRHGDGFHALGESLYDVIYLDPMFPARAKGALPGKRLQVLGELARPDERPLAWWLERARAAARHRVVVKRRSKDPMVETPDWQIRGRTVRFDVYRGRANFDTDGADRPQG